MNQKRLLLLRDTSIFLLVAILIATVLGYPSPVHTTVYGLIVSSLFYLLFAFNPHSEKLSEENILRLVIIGIVLRAIPLLKPAVLSYDAYRYLWDGLVLANGFNPYIFYPNHPALNSLQQLSIYSLVGFREYAAVYPPVATLLFFVATIVGGVSNLFFLKFLILLSEIGILILIQRILTQLKKPKHFILFYALSPLAIVHFSVDAHLDTFGILFLAFAIHQHYSGKTTSSSISLAFSFTTKLFAVVALPILIAKQFTLRQSVKYVFVFALVVIAVYTPFINGGIEVFNALGKFSAHWIHNGSLFDVILELVGENFFARKIALLIFVALYILLFFSKYSTIEKIHLAFLFVILLSPIVHPWYIIWITFLTAIQPRKSSLVLSATASLASVIYINHRLYGTWEEHWWINFLEYAPVYLLLIYELTKEKKLFQFAHPFNSTH